MLDMLAIPARSGAITRVERKSAEETILIVFVLVSLVLCVSRVGRLSTFASLLSMYG